MHKFYLSVAVIALSLLCGTRPSDAGLIGGLGSIRELATDSFEVDFFVALMVDLVGDELEFINLDIVNTNVNSVPITDYTRVEFNSVGGFIPWQGTEQFGQTLGFESIVSLDAFNIGGSPVTFIDTTPFHVGTFTVDYSGLGLSSGDKVTLDITGADDGTSTRTTSGAVFDPNTFISQLMDFDFTTPLGPGVRTLTLSTTGGPGPGGQVPEPSGAIIVLLSAVALQLRRSRA